MNRRPRKRGAPPRLTAREASRNVLEMLGLEDVAPPLRASEGVPLSEHERASRDEALAGVGLTRDLRALVVLSFKHEPASLPGDRIHVRRGSREGERVPSKKSPSGARRTRPTPRMVRACLRAILDYIDRANPDADALKCAALILMLWGLDNSPAVWSEDAPEGRDRVAWLASRIKQLARPPRTGTYRG